VTQAQSILNVVEMHRDNATATQAAEVVPVVLLC